MKSNHMWRMAYVGYEEGSSAQCLTCKEYFPVDYDSVSKYCPCCGTRLEKEFTKKNKRWGWFTWKQHFPVVEFWCLVDRYVELDTWSFGWRKKEKLEQVWKKRGSILLNFNGSQTRKQLLSLVQSNSKVIDSPTKMKLVIKTWDGKEKVIFGSQLKTIFNREYRKIDPPKPYTTSCSGMIDVKYLQNDLMYDTFMTSIKQGKW